MSKKAVSALIVVVLLIVFTVAISTLIVSWMFDYTKATTDAATESATGEKGITYCANSNVEITNVDLKNTEVVSNTSVSTGTVNYFNLTSIAGTPTITFTGISSSETVDGVVGWWHFDEAGGATCTDSSGTGNTGTISGGMNTTIDGNLSSGRISSGKFDEALQFDGLDDFVSVPDSASLDFTDELTIEAWFNPQSSGWTKKKPITITGSTSDLTDHQINITVDYDSDMQTDFDDLRFVDASGNVLNYWIEEYTASTDATFWVKVPSIPTTGATIYMYYGNPSASNESNGTATFEFFDDFSGDLSRWTSVAGTWSISDGMLALSSPMGSSDRLLLYVTDEEFSDAVLEFKMMLVPGSGYGGGYWRGDGTVASAPVWVIVWYLEGFSTWHLGTNGQTMGGDSYSGLSPVGVWRDAKSEFFGTNHKVYVDNNLVFSKSSVTDTNPGKVGVYSWDGVASPLGYWDDFRVRKYASIEPTATIGNETSVGVSKAGAYGIGANTTTAFATINDQIITASISAGWNHVALTYDKDAGGTDEMKLYINSVESATGDYSAAINTNSNNMLIGDLFNGTVDEVRVYNRALSGEEIAGIYDTESLTVTQQTENPKASFNGYSNVLHIGSLTNGQSVIIEVATGNFTIGENNITIYTDAGVVDYSVGFGGISAVISNTGMNNVTVKQVVVFKNDGTYCVLKNDSTTFAVGGMFSVFGCGMECNEFVALKAFTDCTGVQGIFSGTPQGCP